MIERADPREQPGRDRTVQIGGSPLASRRRSALLRVLILAGTGALTCLGYAAILTWLAGLEAAWVWLAAAAAVGALVGAAFGSLLGTRRDGCDTDSDADR